MDGLILFIKRNFEYGKDVLQISTTYFSVIWSRNMRNAIYIIRTKRSNHLFTVCSGYKGLKIACDNDGTVYVLFL